MRFVARVGPVALTLLALADCASRSEWAPRCERGARFAPEPACLAASETQLLTERLDALISDQTDPIAVLVGFDASGRVESVCAVHTIAPKQWDGQRELNARLPEILQTPAGPACLAGRTLVFNEAGAVIGGLRALLADCRVFQAGSTGLYDPLCLQARQVRRGELWFFSYQRDYPYVFVPDAQAKARGQVLSRCTDDVGVMPTQLPEVTIGFTRNHEKLTRCMQGLGWKQTL